MVLCTSSCEVVSSHHHKIVPKLQTRSHCFRDLKSAKIVSPCPARELCQIIKNFIVSQTVKVAKLDPTASEILYLLNCVCLVPSCQTKLQIKFYPSVLGFKSRILSLCLGFNQVVSLCSSHQGSNKLYHTSP